MFVNFEHRLLSLLKQKSCFQKKLLLGVSGGADSMALLEGFDSLKKAGHLDFVVGHIHHGWSSQSSLREFRQKSWEFVKKSCEKRNLIFLSNISHISQVTPSQELLSEEDFRNLRYGELERLLREQKRDFLVLAHHQEDLLETRLIRLIRGTHLHGLRAMEEVSSHILRPLLSFSKKDIESYLKIKEVTFLVDPSNESTDPFRNWIRNTWLPLLEQKQPGAQQSLARSLTHILSGVPSERGGLNGERFLVNHKELDLSQYWTLSESEKLEVLAFFLRENGVYKYTQNHLRELLKRLDGFSKKTHFRLLKRSWLIDGETLSALDF